MLRTESDLERTQQPFNTKSEDINTNGGVEMSHNPSSAFFNAEMRMVPETDKDMKKSNKETINLVDDDKISKASDAEEKEREEEESDDEPDKEAIPRFDENGNEYSLFERYDRVLINEPVESLYLHTFKIFLSAFGLVGYLTYFKRAYEGDRWGKQ